MEEEQGTPLSVYQPTGSVISGVESPAQSSSRPSSGGQQSRRPVQDRKGKGHDVEGTGKRVRKGRGIQEGLPHDGEKGSSSRRGTPTQGDDKRAGSKGDNNKGITSHHSSRPGSPSRQQKKADSEKIGRKNVRGEEEQSHSLGSTDPERNKARPSTSKPVHRTRAPKFNPGLTAPAVSVQDETSTSRPQPPNNSRPPESSKQRQKHKPRHTQPLPDDLTSTLIKALSTRPFQDCSICFSAIHPLQPTWSCSPSIPQVVNASGDGATAIPQYCWNTFHLRCIKSWAEKSVKELEKAWQNRGETDKKGEWRCPGCQARREAVPTGYWCFCNSTPDPKPPRLATPHSCAGPCSRVRETGCGHACPLLCHPGPCPPCRVTLQLPCPCPRHQIVAFRCGDDGLSGKGKGKEDTATREKGVSCGNICGRILDCGKHSCERVCHTGECGMCELMEDVKCYCGRSSNLFRCGEGKEVPCSIRNTEGNDVESWVGSFQCESICDRLFDCGIHRCQKLCHPPSPEPATCPFSPSKITHCPCGKYAIASQDDSSSSLDESIFPSRQTCASPIPTCDSTCGKIRVLCGHECSTKCHLGPCPPCGVRVTRPCRCGLTTLEIKCADFITEEGEKELLCDRQCMVLRACGKHECRRLCCPLASLAFGKGKKGRAVGTDLLHPAGIGEEKGGLHECDLPCGKMLACGNHTCDERDHRGPCPSCLRSTFEEVFCACGRTVLEPPVRCGTKIDCHYQCPRIPSCGHPPMSHTCHEEPPSCPPCAYLTTKLCACGKKEMVNIKCSLERDKVSCAIQCGRLLSCGFHRCQRFCHAADCGPCAAQCGKDRKLCLPAHHPCTRACHAPSACPEDEPCEALVSVSCPCGRLKQSLRCGLSNSRSEGAASSHMLKCNGQCEIAKRNARLAEALGISDESREKAVKYMAGGPVVYPDEVVAFAKEDPKFVLLVEKTYAEFIASNKRSQVLPHMPQEKRKFVHSLAGIYRLDAQMVDQEPLRSVQVVRRLDSRVPIPLLSASVASAVPAPPNLGKSGVSTGSGSAWRVPSKPGSPAPAAVATSSGARGWGPTANTKTANVPTSSSMPTSSGKAVPSRSLTPDVGSGVRGIQPKLPEEGINVPDNWEDDA